MAGRVVVVGAGNAALTAALSARESGAEVQVLEAAPVDERGGNSRFTGALFRVAHGGLADLMELVEPPSEELRGRLVVDPYPSSTFFADLQQASRGRGDAASNTLLVRRSRDTLSWMKGHGVEFELAVGKLIDPDADTGNEYVLPSGGAVRVKHEGPGLVADLFAAAERIGVQVRYDAAVHDVIADGTRVRGVTVRGPEGEESLEGAVILACGGFEANAEMRLRYLGAGWDLVKVRGSRFNTGLMLHKALSAGAAASGHWAGCHATPVDADAPDFGRVELVDTMSRYSYLYGLLVNAAGDRFVDEGEDEVWRTYAKTGAAIRAQDGSIAYQLFDAKTIHLLEPRYSTATPVRADTLGDLAQRLGLPTDRLVATVKRYNAAVQPGSFDPFRKDGVCTSGVQPPKSNWALPFDTPPYAAFRVTCGITFTYGGLATNHDAQVLDFTGRPMPGLYAVGEISGGGFYFNYPAGSGLMRGAIFGRIAGHHAATGETFGDDAEFEHADAFVAQPSGERQLTL